MYMITPLCLIQTLSIHAKQTKAAIAIWNENIILLNLPVLSIISTFNIKQLAVDGLILNYCNNEHSRKSLFHLKQDRKHSLLWFIRAGELNPHSPGWLSQVTTTIHPKLTPGASTPGLAGRFICDHHKNSCQKQGRHFSFYQGEQNFDRLPRGGGQNMKEN